MSPRGAYKPQIENKNALPGDRWNILRGDNVIVIDKHLSCFGEKGVVKEVLRKTGRVIIEGVNVGKRNVKGNPQTGAKGKIVDKPLSVHYSNVNLVDPVSGTATRVARKFLEDGTKVRIAKKSGAVIPRPADIAFRRKPRNLEIGDKDTAAEDVWEVTYKPGDK